MGLIWLKGVKILLMDMPYLLFEFEFAPEIDNKIQYDGIVTSSYIFSIVIIDYFFIYD